MIKRGDIYYVNSVYPPAVGSEQRPGRPAIVVSNNANNAHCDVVDVVYLTTKDKADLPTHCKILSGARESTALCEHIDSVSISRLGDLLTVCSPKEMLQVNKCLRIALALDQGDHCDHDDSDAQQLTRAEVVIRAGVDADLARDDQYGRCAAETSHDLPAELLMLQVERDTYKAMYNEILQVLLKKGGQ